MKNNNFIVLLMAILCFTVLPSFTILDEDITIPETEINVELEAFVTELRVELVKFTDDLNLMTLKGDLEKNFYLAPPDEIIELFGGVSACGTPGSGYLMWFSELNDEETVSRLCQFNGQGSYRYLNGAQNCIVITCLEENN